jgi:glyoxylase-like metal-dependent hydrolase (beta-lactamase superfamily II)
MPTQVRFVTDSIVCVRRPSYLTCSYLVRVPSGVIVVDAGMASDGADVRRGLEAFGLEVDSVRGILLTHWHNDHAAGAEAIRAASQAPVFYHRGDEAALTGSVTVGRLRRWLSAQIPELGVLVLLKGLLGEAVPRPIAVAQTVGDGELLFQDFEVVSTPGHTPGHVSYFYRPERVLFAGDALAVVGGRLRFMSRSVTPDKALARASVARCLSVEPAIVCPGHREPLLDGVEDACARLRARLAADAPWPLLG